MPETRKPITPHKVRAVLRKAGHAASKSTPTRIRGFHEHTDGYRLLTYRDGTIHVVHMAAFHGGFSSRNQDALERYLETLRAAQIACEIDLGRVVIRP